ncbi:hypothetical protein Ppa06_05520 [Planomonospora parontospora subsp. parontospora]|uniref:Mce-associated membrane protein n=2 Tax=Planomonospora parontospora TaxID=58119 RepID=A0AA37BCD6_9ACTN|nr:hypothetical protein [Planomonospora parontospora]GGK48853.1 hypothetical protein GCM10010126_05530 [Planomonospora parontospora]GII06754.1 hypothetical protein Ppa06_05520 [Planomonospora parontospora subsp. parontospora]
MSPTSQKSADPAEEAPAADSTAADSTAVDTAAVDTAAGELGQPGEPGTPAAAWRRRLVWAVAGALLTGTAAFGTVQWVSAERLADRLATERSERLAVSTRAGEFAVALQTYDHTDLQAYRDRVFGLSGEDFEKTYDEAFSPLESVISAMKASSTASVRDVYVSEVADGRARAITVVDSQVKSTAGTRRMLGAHMELGLVKVGGQWRVNDATVMGAADELVTDPDGKAVEPGPAPSPTGKNE